ncbi:Uncharacterised protein [Chlamydia trachomatis]|nr:Uncharacterised protein [Chlamydia trachomatis]
MVMILVKGPERCCMTLYKVVVFPLPVGPVTNRIPSGTPIAFLKEVSILGGIHKPRISKITLRLSSMRNTTRSP